MSSGEFKGVWVFSENKDLAFELLGKGRELANKLGVELAGLLLGQGVANQAEELISYGADKVYVADDPALKSFQPEPYKSVIADLASKYKPEILLIGGTRRGKELAPRIATVLETGCSSDCKVLDIDTSKRLLLMDRLVYGGNAVSTLVCRSKPQIATVPPRTFDKPQAAKRKGEVVKVEVKAESPRTQILETKAKEVSGAKIEEASIVVLGGRGMKSKEDFKILDELAKILGGQVGVTRPLAADLEWFPEWVGLSGKTIKPMLFIGAGASGAIQLLAGMRDSRVIVAVNKDPEAPIFKAADYGIVGDLYEVVPALTAAFKEIFKK